MLSPAPILDTPPVINEPELVGPIPNPVPTLGRESPPSTENSFEASARLAPLPEIE